MKFVFGVDLGGTTVKIAFFDQMGTLLHKWEIPTRRAQRGKEILPDIAVAIEGFLQERGLTKEQILGIGIGAPGPVDEDGLVNRCENLGWGVFNIHKVLGEYTGLPVKAGNDANLAALGEAWKGGGVGCRNMVLATFGTGVGGGMIIDGKPLNGVHGSAGEIGHITLDRRETEPCNCGKLGCAEQYCSATGVVRLANKYLQQRQTPSLLRDSNPLTCKAVFDAAAEGDIAAQEILEQVFDYMGQLLAIISCTVDPEVIVFGGGVSRAGQPLLTGARPHFEKYVFHAARPVRFALATLGNDAGAYGACKLILDEQERK